MARQMGLKDAKIQYYTDGNDRLRLLSRDSDRCGPQWGRRPTLVRSPSLRGAPRDAGPGDPGGHARPDATGGGRVGQCRPRAARICVDERHRCPLRGHSILVGPRGPTEALRLRTGVRISHRASTVGLPLSVPGPVTPIGRSRSERQDFSTPDRHTTHGRVGAALRPPREPGCSPRTHGLTASTQSVEPPATRNPVNVQRSGGAE